MKTNTRWYLIGWMLIISAVSYLDRVNISIAGKALEAEFGLSDIQLGWVFSSFVLGYALFQAPGGRLADRWGPRRLIALATVWWAVFTALTGLTPSRFAGALTVLLAVRFALGVGESVTYPASNRLVASWIPSRERGLANGLIFAGVGIGAGISPPLITWIMLRDGWRASFVLSAALGLVAGLVWFFLCRDKPEGHPWVSTEEAEYIHEGLPRAERNRSLSWAVILSNRSVAFLTASYATFGYSAYIFFTWFFIYLTKVRNLDVRSGSVFGMLPFLAMAVCSPLGGWLSDRVLQAKSKRVARCGMAGAAMALAAVFIVCGPLVDDVRLASFILTGGAGALYLSQSMFWAVSSEIGGESAGSVSGVMNMGNQLAGALTASLSPFIANHLGWPVSFGVAACLCALGAVAWAFVNPDAPATPHLTTQSAGLKNAAGIPHRN